MSQSEYLDSRPRIFHQSHLLHELACPLLQEVCPLWSRAPQTSHQLPKLEMTGWLPYAAATGAASSKGKEVGAVTAIQCSSSQGCTLSPALPGIEKTPVCLEVEKVVQAGRHFLKTSGSRTFLGGGCCCCFSGCVGTAPGYLCASTAWQPASPFLFFFL